MVPGIIPNKFTTALYRIFVTVRKKKKPSGMGNFRGICQL